jgi:thiaminase
MIYLVQLDNVYKIGYAKDVEKRIKNLSPTHVIVDLIHSMEGTIADEKELHKLCKEFKIKNELFELREEVIEIFKNYIPFTKEIVEEVVYKKHVMDGVILPENYSFVVILSDKEISDKLNISERTVKRLHKGLIAKDLLEIQNGVKIFKNIYD